MGARWLRKHLAALIAYRPLTYDYTVAPYCKLYPGVKHKGLFRSVMVWLRKGLNFSYFINFNIMALGSSLLAALKITHVD